MNLEREENGTQRLLVVSEATSRDLLSYTVILVIICNAYQHLLEEISTLQVYLGHLTLAWQISLLDRQTLENQLPENAKDKTALTQYPVNTKGLQH